MYEYFIISVSDCSSLDRRINAAAEMGWKLVNITISDGHYYAAMKRKKP